MFVSMLKLNEVLRNDVDFVISSVIIYTTNIDHMCPNHPSTWSAERAFKQVKSLLVVEFLT